jgi:rhamnogalacturonan endolyase
MLMCRFLAGLSILLAALAGCAHRSSTDSQPNRACVSTAAPVGVSEDADSFCLSNGLVTARIVKRSGVLASLRYQGQELMASGHGGMNGGYWSSFGRTRPDYEPRHSVTINPATNGGALAEISCQLNRGGNSVSAPGNIDYRYALAQGQSALYVYCILEHKPGYPFLGAGEARYCLKLSPEVFDYLSIDGERHRVMPSGKDWDQGKQLNLSEVRRMTTGAHAGEVEHKYDYSALFYQTPAYGWQSTGQRLGLWMINPSLEYIGGGPTKAELTGHLDCNPGGLPTLLNMWVGSHYGGTSLGVGTDESWSKVVGPFVLYCNATPEASGNIEKTANALWKDALKRAASESRRWPYAWVSSPYYARASERGSVTGQLVLHDPGAPKARMSNIWVGVTAPDYNPARGGGGFGPRRFGTNAPPWGWFTNGGGGNPPPGTNGGFGGPGRGFGQPWGRGGLPPQMDWQRDAKFYQFWIQADTQGRFEIPKVRSGTYTLHAIADGVLGEFVQTNVTVAAGQKVVLGRLEWTPKRFGETVWEIGVPNRTAREFRHGDHFWQWGLYYKYPAEFPQDVRYVVGKSDWSRDWNYVQPPRINSGEEGPVMTEEEEGSEAEPAERMDRRVKSTTWTVEFAMVKPPVSGKATLRLALCGAASGCRLEASVNGQSIGDTGPLPATSTMHRDGIGGYWIEKDLTFDAALLKAGTNVLELHSPARSWNQGVLYDYLRLEAGPAN